MSDHQNGAALVPVTTPTGEALSLPAQLIEAITASGNLGVLNEAQRADYLLALCRSLGLNPLSRPIEFMDFKGKIVPYARKDCTDQLRNLRGVSIEITRQEIVDDVCTVVARATLNGRTDEDLGVVDLGGLKGQDRANWIMKAMTKAKRRVTLSICGLGILDESEIEDAGGSLADRLAGSLHGVVMPGQNAQPARNPIAVWQPRIQAAKTQAELDRISNDMGKEPMTGRELKALGAVWKARSAELAPKKDAGHDKAEAAPAAPAGEAPALEGTVEPTVCRACDSTNGQHMAGCPEVTPPAAEAK